MELHTIDLSPDFDYIYLLPISDLHLGDPNCNIEKFLGYRDWLEETPNAYTLLNGDILNTAIKDSVSDIYTETMSPQEQIKKAVELFSPVKDKILGVVNGNHERRISKIAGIDITEVMADRLGVWYAGDEVFIKLRFGRKPNKKPVAYTIYSTHGFGSGRTVGSKVNNLQKLSDIVLADLYIASHTHFMTAHQDIYLVPDTRNNNIMKVKRTFVSSGAFLDRGRGYGVQKGYPACKLGSPRIRLDGTRRDCHVSI